MATLLKRFCVLILMVMCSGCATLFGWQIHAPGVLSNNYYEQVKPVSQRVALYFPPHFAAYTSENKGGRFADPQIYYIGEAFSRMLVEAFGAGFDQFILLDAEPTAELLQVYDIPYLVAIDVHAFRNDVRLKGQTVELDTVVFLFDHNLRLKKRLLATGSSDAQKVFGKKGGPEVNLNAAIENNVRVTVQFLQDLFTHENLQGANP